MMAVTASKVFELLKQSQIIKESGTSKAKCGDESTFSSECDLSRDDKWQIPQKAKESRSSPDTSDRVAPDDHNVHSGIVMGGHDDDDDNEGDCDSLSMLESSDSEWLPSEDDADDSHSHASESGVDHVSDSEVSETGSTVFPMLESCCKLTVGRDSEEKSSSSTLTDTHPEHASQTTRNGLKKHCCKFCQKLNTKMSTHLMRCHALEPEVSTVLKMKKGDPDRRRAFIKLQDEGDYHYNCRVLRDREGSLIPKYRKNEEPTTQDYRACPHCKAIYRRQLLSKHEPRCPQKSCDSKRLKKGQCAAIGRLLLPLPPDTNSAFFINVLSKLQNDDIGRIVVADSLIVHYGERLYFKRDCEEHTYGQINGRLRELGRLLQVLRRNTSMQIATLTHAIDPANFEALVKAVRELGNFNPSSNQYGKGALAQKLGLSLKKCSLILKAEAIKADDDETQRKCERFEALYTSDWSDKVSALASQSVQRARMNKPKLLPSVNDVEKVNSLLKKDMLSGSYVTLAKSTLAAITVFNRKRGGEVQRMKVSDYERSKKRSTNPPEEELLADLTETEKKLINILHRVEIRGKFNRAVPVLLTQTMVKSVESLVAMRSLMDIDSAYLFVTPTGVRPYRGSQVLQEYANAAKVSDVSLFTATTLRKQLATLSQAMAISELDQDELATFLGHDLRIHRSIYRQTLDVVQKTRVASFLLRVNRGVEMTEQNVDDVNVDEEVLETEQLNAAETENNSEDEDQMDVCGLPESVSTGQITPPQAAKPAPKTNSKSTPAPKTKSRSIVKQSHAKRSWTEKETKAVQKHLLHCVVMNRVPQKHECEQALASEPVLKNRKWTDIKFFVYNMLKKKR